MPVTQRKLLLANALLPDREETRARQLSERFFRSENFGAAADYSSIVQPIAFIRWQRRPSCVGQSFCACVDKYVALDRIPWHPSASGLWIDSRRRQGTLENANAGTRFEYAVESAIYRGLAPFRDDEELDDVAMTRAADLLEGELPSHDFKLLEQNHSRISPGDLDALDAALHEGWSAMLGSGVADSYLALHTGEYDGDRVATRDDFGDRGPGHGQRIFAKRVVKTRRQYGIQNSWSEDWGGMHLPDGTYQPGCVWSDEDCIRDSHDLHLVRIT